MRQRRSGPVRSPLDFPNPIDLIVDMIKWRLRAYGTRLVTGVVLTAGLAIVSVAFFAPFVVAGLAIAVFGLAQEPYKWLGTVLIVVAFVVGVVAAPLVLRQVLRRSHGIVALTQLGDDDVDEQLASQPSPTVAPSSAAAQTRAAKILALDARLAKPRDTESSGATEPETGAKPG